MIDITLNNGVVMPALGLGVFQTPPDETTAAVASALDTGYRHIDTAAAYFNEREVGLGIARSGVPRDEIFIETKVWISDYGYDQTLHAFDKSAGKLGVDQIDLLILHQALPGEFQKTIDAYRALERLLADGRVRAIGVSNFMRSHLDALIEQTTVVPAINQIELHPYFSQPDVQAADAERGIVTQAWSPIGGITSYRGGGKSAFEEPVLLDIAARFDKSAGKLGVDQIDLLILHQALPGEFQKTVDAYTALERLLADGRVRAIGVSNFMRSHLDALIEQTTVVPAINQIELHPYFSQPDVQAADAERGIVTQAWSPIGGITSYRGGGKSAFEEPVLLDIGAQSGKSAAQVMLRWGLQHGRSVIPKSTKPERIAENFDVFDFELTADQMTAIDALDTGVRGGPEPEAVTLEAFGREIPEA